MDDGQFMERVEELVRVWKVAVECTLETQSSFLVFGARDNQPVVLKALRHPGDEWNCGRVLDAFNGRGMARVYEYTAGAALLERLQPGTALAGLALSGRDDEATEILAEIIHRMSHPPRSLEAFVTVQDWGRGFQRYLASGDEQVPITLVEQAQRRYMELCATQRRARLLHGDLHHYNVLRSIERGWVAIDPKGVVGEIECELGAILRNPYERPELFASSQTIERRLMRFDARLKLDCDRALRWGFAQAVLSAIWLVEDGFTLEPGNSSLTVAHAISSMLE
jgi:streptomycin 6-kinase